MNSDYTIKPSTLFILGGIGEERHQSSTAQKEPQHEGSCWQRFKSTVKKIGGFIKQAVSYVKNDIVPILDSVTGFINAINNCKKTRGYAPCAA